VLYQDSIETLYAYAAFDAARTFFETRLDAAIRLAIYLNPLVSRCGACHGGLLDCTPRRRIGG
jgi:hypothetical protein